MTLTQARVHGRRLSPPCTWPRTALALSTSLRRRLGTRQRPMTESAECTVVVERLGIIYVLDTWTARPGPRRHSVVALNTLVIFMGMSAHAHLLFCMHIAHVYSHTRICIIRGEHGKEERGIDGTSYPLLCHMLYHLALFRCRARGSGGTHVAHVCAECSCQRTCYPLLSASRGCSTARPATKSLSDIAYLTSAPTT